MSIHQQDKNMRPDEDFLAGDLSFLVVGNKCRLLDGRRTPGYIEQYDHEYAMFRWKITNFEDKGSYWDVPAEKIVNYQFEKDSLKLTDNQVNKINKQMAKYQTPLVIKTNEKELLKTNQLIEVVKTQAIDWLKANSLFFKANEKIDFNNKTGHSLLAEDLKTYMESKNLLDQEIKTAKLMVLNPSSGEWIKGLRIVLAEIGLVDYKGKISRSEDIFLGIGSKDNRKKYIIHRLAFIRAYFSLLGISDVVLYRGMAGEKDFAKIERSFLSCTFNVDVAKSFSGNIFDETKYRIAYVVKMTCSVNQMFMTYIETEQMNQQYKEAEGILLYQDKIQI